MKRLLAVFLCLSLLLGSVTVLAEGSGMSTPRTNISDNVAPNLVKFVFTEDGKTLRPGDTLHLQMKLEDRSDIRECEVQFVLKSSDLLLQVPLAYDAASDTYKGEYVLSKNEVNGTYIINILYAVDKHGNSLLLQEDKKGFGKFKMKGGIKNLKLKGTAKIKGNGKVLEPDDEVTLKVKLDKENPDAAYMDATFVPETQPKTGTIRYQFVLEPISTKTYEGEISFQEGTRNGKYLLESVSLYDAEYNVLGIMEVKGQYVILKGSSDDKTAPVISAVTLQEKGKKLTGGDTIHISARIRDKSDVDVIAFVMDKNAIEYLDGAATVKKTKDSHLVELEYKKSTGKYEGSWKLPKDLPDGQYSLVVNARDEADNLSYKTFEDQCFTYTSPDVADKGMKAFVTECWKALFGKEPTKGQLRDYATPLATGKKKAVSIIKTLVKKSGLTGEAAAEALWQIMQGKAPTAEEKAATVEALKVSLNNGIDSLNNAAFRQRCKDWGIKPGTLGTKSSDTKVDSVDVDGGHYTLNGNKATLTGVTKKDVKSLKIPATVSANGKTYKVTKIDGAACKGLSKLTTLTIGKNVTTIGQDAFKDCAALNSITVSGTKLKTVGKDSFSGISRKATFKCPAKQLAKYKDLFRKNGNAPRNAKFE